MGKDTFAGVLLHIERKYDKEATQGAILVEEYSGYLTGAALQSAGVAVVIDVSCSLESVHRGNFVYNYDHSGIGRPIGRFDLFFTSCFVTFNMYSRSHHDPIVCIGSYCHVAASQPSRKDAEWLPRHILSATVVSTLATGLRGCYMAMSATADVWIAVTTKICVIPCRFFVCVLCVKLFRCIALLR
ncbi:hypothetical protein Y032_0491g2406 [Ancylostoma ceylanicum]|uniref:Uncharacterized protein n=1 Tax=Ancylostoma ceylanicum TaxID=53326 RepID=A0A016WVD0_9BILA|nr:hypothetical protein Y032_0491g2406 [Ancylostoma ceylanicum]